ncbi:hypothetical protein C8R47DRAFT_1099863 [Mycena vitilis]|nr:hypothetical protein C8R47DRAFT_1099863 [Mycena vitilis]
MLVSREWLIIVLSVVFRNLWITSRAHLRYIVRICLENTSFVFTLAGISNIHHHLAETCQSLTISVQHPYEGQYSLACTHLIEYATAEQRRNHLIPATSGYTQAHTIPPQEISLFVAEFIPRITALHFVFIDCNATYRDWDTLGQGSISTPYPCSLVELHVTFAYTSPPPALLLDAPRHTFFPPPHSNDTPFLHGFGPIKRLVVREANADFVAFLTTACPSLQIVESTAEFGAEDVPDDVAAHLKARLVFMRLPRTTSWPGLTADTVPLPDDYMEQRIAVLRRRFEQRRRPEEVPATPPVVAVPVKKTKKRVSICQLARRVFRSRKRL